MQAKRGLEGFFPVTVTPFDEGGDLMIDAFAEILAWHIDRGADGLAIAADNGEGWSLSGEERRRMAETAVRVAGGRVPVIMGTMGPGTVAAEPAIAAAEIAAEAGVDAVLVSPQPYFGRGTDAEVIERYRTIHQAVPLPMVVYDNPGHFGIPVQGDLLESLLGEIDIVGIKESSRDFYEITEAIARFGERLCIFVGCGWFVFPGLAQGAGGTLATGTDLFGAQSERIIALATAAPTPESRAMHRRISRLYRYLMETGTYPAAQKAALNLLGLPAGRPRRPVLPLPPEKVAELRALMIELGALDAEPAVADVGA